MGALASRLALGILCCLPAGPARASSPSAAPPALASIARPERVRPLPAVAQLAARRGIALEGFELAGPGEAPRPGDTLAVLFTIDDGKQLRQWLTEFRLDQLTDREARSKPGSGLGLAGMFFSSLHTDTGHEFHFETTPLAIALRTFGPFAGEANSPPPPAPVTARVLAGRAYLLRGLAPMCEIESRLRATGKIDPGLSYLFRPHFSDEQVAQARTRAAAAGFTVEDESAFAEGFLALIQFAWLAMRTDGVADITGEIIETPGLFTSTFINPDWSRLALENGAAWGLDQVRLFRVPYHFLSKTNAQGALFATAPRPPLVNMAGIVGLTIDWNSKVPTKRLIVRVLAGRRGPP